MKTRNKIFEYLLYKIKNNLSEFKFNRTYEYGDNCTKEIEGINTLCINRTKLCYNLSLTIYNNSNYKLEKTIDYNYYMFNSKYWKLRKYFKIIEKMNDYTVMKLLETDDLFFDKTEMRNIKLKNIN